MRKTFLQWLEDDQKTVVNNRPAAAAVMQSTPSLRTHPEMRAVMAAMGGHDDNSGIDPSFIDRKKKNPDGYAMGTPEYMAPEQAKGLNGGSMNPPDYFDDPIQNVVRLYGKIWPGLDAEPKKMLQAWMDFRTDFYNHIQEGVQEGFRDFFRRTNIQQDPRGQNKPPTPQQTVHAAHGDVNRTIRDREENARQPHQAEYMRAWTSIRNVNPKLEKLNKALENVFSPQMQELRDKFQRFYSMWTRISGQMANAIQTRAGQAGHDLHANVSGKAHDPDYIMNPNTKTTTTDDDWE